jgi:signal transduction histidine kinase/integral membrane sensor domain MASE1/ActR/RegA family two-component response regulator
MWNSEPQAHAFAIEPGRNLMRTSVGWFFVALFGYAALAVGSVELAPALREAQPIWFADGFALGLLRIAPMAMRGPILIGVFIANVFFGFYSGAPWQAIPGGAATNVLQAFLASALIDYAKKRSPEWGGLRSVGYFYLIAFFGVNSLCALIHVLNGSLWTAVDMTKEFRTLVVSDGLGILLMTPLVSVWAEPWNARYRTQLKRRRWELLLLGLGLIGTTIWVYTRPPDESGLAPPLFYMGIPFLVWAVLRFGRHAATGATLVYALLAIYYTAKGEGPFYIDRQWIGASVEHLQEFLFVTLGIVHLLSATTRDRVTALRLKTDIERRYDAAMFASGNLIFEIDPESGGVQWAGDTQQVLGIARHKIANLRDWTAHVHPDDRPDLMDIRAKLIRDEEPSVALEYRVMREPEKPGRPLPYFVTVGVSAFSYESISDEGDVPERHIIGFIKDISEKQRAEAERKKLEAELRQAQKMEAIGRLAGGIAHDFNNILASILGYGELARDKAQDGSPSARHLDAILKAGDRGRAMVAQILMFSRKNVAEATVIELRSLVEEVAELVRGSTTSTINLVVTPADLATPVLGNATELHQLLMNVVTNGLQAMPEGSALSINLQAVVLAEQMTIAQGMIGPGEFVRVDISDSGTGIDDATLERMFEPFFSTKPTGKGTGLGLSLAQAIAKAHEGGIDVQSNVGAGSTFSIFLPITRDRRKSVPIQSPVRRGSGERVMLVDDESALLDLGCEILTELGYDPVPYNRSAEALAAFVASPAQWDLILTDEVMPQLTGTELAARIHRTRSDLPVIIITAHGGPGFELRAHEAGVTRVMRKPYQRRELAEALSRALDGTGARN